MTGVAKFVQSDGRIFVGEFKNYAYHGRVVVTELDGSKYLAQYEKNHPTGSSSGWRRRTKKEETKKEEKEQRKKKQRKKERLKKERKIKERKKY